MGWVDISTPVYAGMPGFPGDPPVRMRRIRRIEAGDPFNLSSLALGTHAGTHVDPPLHFVADAPGVDSVPFERLNGPCHVLEIPPTVRSVGADQIRNAPERTERLLLRTQNSDRWRAGGKFFADYTALEPDGASEILRRKIGLVGIDSLSIESDSTGTFPVHHQLLEAGVIVLEGLRLAEVLPGDAELRCMPLRIQGGDGGPCRAAIFRP